jgi:hypothetical protein
MSSPPIGRGEVPQREPQVAQQFNHLERRQEVLNSTLEHLCQRLSPICQNEPPKAIGKAVNEVMVPVAERLNAAALRTQTQIDVVESLLQRLEL